MSNRVDVDVLGFQQLADKVKTLGDDKDKRRESLVILRQIAKPTLNASKAIVPVSKQKHFSRGKYIAPGALKKSLGIITVRTENPSVVVGTRAKGKFDGWYGNMVHEGHEYFTSANQQTKLFYKNNARFSTARNLNRGSAKNKKRKTKRERANLRAAGRAKMTRPQRFLKDAYEQTKGKVTSDAENQFAAFIQRRINRLSK